MLLGLTSENNTQFLPREMPLLFSISLGPKSLNSQVHLKRTFYMGVNVYPKSYDRPAFFLDTGRNLIQIESIHGLS